MWYYCNLIHRSNIYEGFLISFIVLTGQKASFCDWQLLLQYLYADNLITSIYNVFKVYEKCLYVFLSFRLVEESKPLTIPMQPSSPQNRHEHSMLSREPSFSQAMYRVSINKQTIVSAIPIFVVECLKNYLLFLRWKNIKKTRRNSIH